MIKTTICQLKKLLQILLDMHAWVGLYSIIFDVGRTTCDDNQVIRCVFLPQIIIVRRHLNTGSTIESITSPLFLPFSNLCQTTIISNLKFLLVYPQYSLVTFNHHLQDFSMQAVWSQNFFISSSIILGVISFLCKQVASSDREQVCENHGFVSQFFS